MEEPAKSRYTAPDDQSTHPLHPRRTLIDPPRYLLDSSVISKVFLLDEELVGETRALFEAFYSGEVSLLTPPIAYFEVANAIVKATRQHRITVEAGRRAIEQLFDLAIETVGDEYPELAVRADYPVAEELNRSIFDSVFLVVARAIDAPFVTADRPTWEVAKANFNVIYLTDLPIL